MEDHHASRLFLPPAIELFARWGITGAPVMADRQPPDDNPPRRPRIARGLTVETIRRRTRRPLVARTLAAVA